MKKEYITINLSELKQFERNPRKNDQAVDAVIKSINETGYISPIIIDENNEILAGHTRLKGLKKLGHDPVEVLKVEGLTDEQKKKYRILENKTGEIAEWDFEILQEDFKLDELVDLGFDIKDLDQGEVIEDEAPSIPETPKTVKGDIYELNGHRVMCGDSTFLDSIEKLLNGERIDMVYTDPPYGINEKTDRDFDSRSRLTKGNSFEKIIGDKTKDTAYSFCNLFIPMNFKKYIIWGANHFSSCLPESPEWLAWDKRVDEVQKDHNSDIELAWVKSGKKSARIFRHKWKGMIKDSENGIRRIHPTQKPIKLAEWCFKNYEAGKIIFDGFLGSGSTLIACEQTNRKCYGMELGEKYCDVIVQRWVNFTKQTKIKRNGIEIDWPISENIQ